MLAQSFELSQRRNLLVQSQNNQSLSIPPQSSLNNSKFPSDLMTPFTINSYEQSLTQHQKHINRLQTVQKNFDSSRFNDFTQPNLQKNTLQVQPGQQSSFIQSSPFNSKTSASEDLKSFSCDIPAQKILIHNLQDLKNDSLSLAGKSFMQQNSNNSEFEQSTTILKNIDLSKYYSFYSIQNDTLNDISRIKLDKKKFTQSPQDLLADLEKVLDDTNNTQKDLSQVLQNDKNIDSSKPKLDEETDWDFFMAAQFEKNNQLSKAIQAYEKVLNNVKQIFTQKSREYAYVLQALANAQWKNGNNLKSKSHYFECLQIQQNLYGNTDVRLGSLLTGLVSALERLGNFYQSLEYGFRCLEIYRLQYKNDDHKQFGKIYNNIGNTLRFLSRYDQAIQYYKKSLQNKRKNDGENSIEYANTLSNIGLTYYKKSMFLKAKQTLQTVLKIYIKTFTSNDLKDQTMTTLGAVQNSMGIYNKAKKYLQQALEIRQTKFTPTHVNCGYTLYHLGVTYQRIGWHKQAYETYKRTLQVFEKNNQKEGRYSAGTFSNLASLFLEKKQFQAAMQFVDKSLELYKKNPDLDYVRYVITVNEKANIYRQMGLYHQALYLYLQAQKMFNERKIQGLIENAKLFQDIALLHLEMEDYQNAIKQIQETIKIRNIALGQHHVDTVRAIQMANKLNALKLNGRFSEETLNNNKQAENQNYQQQF